MANRRGIIEDMRDGDVGTYRLISTDDLDARRTSSLRAIYEDGFADNVRVPWDEVTAHRHPREEALALVADDAPVGFAIVRTLADTGIVFLRYLVVDRKSRGRGIGSEFWRQLTAWAVQRGFALLVWDVEHPDEPEISADERSIRFRRIGFYERLGGLLLPVEKYVNPFEHNGEVSWHPMLLMAISLDGTPVPSDAHGLRRITTDVYAHRYGLGSETAEVRATLDAIGA